MIKIIMIIIIIILKNNNYYNDYNNYNNFALENYKNMVLFMIRLLTKILNILL